MSSKSDINEITPFAATPPANFRLFVVSALAAAIGIAAGFIAYLLYLLIGFFTNLFFYQRISFEFVSPLRHSVGLWVVLIPALGGILVGLMAKYGSSKIRGHGIPEAMEAVAFNRSRIAPRVAILKPLSAAIAIGAGGPFGAEGPIIQTGGAIGSLVGQLLHTTATERKVLLACGAAAGMAATFSTPIAAVILAIELLLFEFKSRSFIPLVIAGALATSVHFLLMGRGPMFDVGKLDFAIPAALPFYLLLGLICGAAAVLFTKGLYWVEDQFERLPIDPMWRPALGGLGLGMIALFVPRVLGVGYETISDILNNRLTLSLLLLILIFKSLALLVSLGSGTSGGLLAPMFMGSAAMGAVFALAVNFFIPAANLSPSAFALAAMGTVFGAASRATFAFIIFAFEITRDYDAVLPLMLVGVIAAGVAQIFLKNSIMTEKLARRGLRIHQGYEVDVFHQTTVGEVMEREVTSIPAGVTVAELADRIGSGDPSVSLRQALPIVDEAGRLVGVITRGDILRAVGQGEAEKTVLEAGARDLIVATPEEILSDALSKMLRHDVGRLPVVHPEEPRKLVGYLSRAAVLSARRKHLEEEHLREPGWLAWSGRR